MALVAVCEEFRAFESAHRSKRPELPIEWRDRWPRLNDRTEHLPFDAHYVYHTAWAARRLAEIRPTRHVDISSLTYFATLCSAFMPVEFYDYRPAAIHLSNSQMRCCRPVSAQVRRLLPGIGLVHAHHRAYWARPLWRPLIQWGPEGTNGASESDSRRWIVADRGTDRQAAVCSTTHIASMIHK